MICYSVGINSADLTLRAKSDRFPENSPTVPLIRAVCSGSSDEATSGSMCVQALPGKRRPVLTRNVPGLIEKLLPILRFDSAGVSNVQFPRFEEIPFHCVDVWLIRKGMHQNPRSASPCSERLWSCFLYQYRP